MTPEEFRLGAVMRETIADCDGCRMKFMGNGPVQPKGKMPNDVMVLGGYPTRTDDKVGAVQNTAVVSNRLRMYLREGGVHLDECFYANALQCWTQGEHTKTELDACRVETIKPILRAVKPKLVLALGADALACVGVKGTIKKLHGRPFRMRAGPFMDVWVWPTWHPGVEDKPGVMVHVAADLHQFGTFYKEMIKADWPEEGVAPWVS